MREWPLECEELTPELPKSPSLDADTSWRQSHNQSVFTAQVLRPATAVEPDFSSSLNSLDKDRRSIDRVPKFTVTSRRQWTTSSRKGTTLKQIVSELEDEANVINDGVTFPIIPPFQSVREMVRRMIDSASF